MKRSGWFVPIAVAVTCIPCLLVPLGAAAIAAGTLGGTLAFLGAPWILAVLLGAVAGAALIGLRWRTKPAACPVSGSGSPPSPAGVDTGGASGANPG